MYHDVGFESLLILNLLPERGESGERGWQKVSVCGGGGRVVACETAADTKEKSSFAKKVHPIYFFPSTEILLIPLRPKSGAGGAPLSRAVCCHEGDGSPPIHSFVEITMRMETCSRLCQVWPIMLKIITCKNEPESQPRILL